MFVQAAGLKVESDSIRQLDPPNPDLTCIIEDNERGFELTLLTDETIERKVRLGRSGYSNFRIDVEDVVNAIRGKNAKNYLGGCIDLVIHEGATPIDGLWGGAQSEAFRLIQAETDSSKFARVWLLDMTNMRVLTFLKA